MTRSNHFYRGGLACEIYQHSVQKNICFSVGPKVFLQLSLNDYRHIIALKELKQHRKYVLV